MKTESDVVTAIRANRIVEHLHNDIACKLRRSTFNDAVRVAVLSLQREWSAIQLVFDAYGDRSQEERDQFFSTLSRMGYLDPQGHDDAALSRMKRTLGISESLELPSPFALGMTFPDGSYPDTPIQVMLWTGLGTYKPSNPRSHARTAGPGHPHPIARRSLVPAPVGLRARPAKEE